MGEREKIVSHVYEQQKQAAAKVAELLGRPMADDPQYQSVEDFDPWEIVPSIYGTYSSDFDDMAIEVLESLNSGEFKPESLAHQMFRELLCNAELCDYGTSPRVCFPTTEFKALLPRLIERWKEWRESQWKDEPSVG